MGVVNISGIELAIIIILLVLIFNRQIAFWVHSTKQTLLSIFANNPRKAKERMEETPNSNAEEKAKKPAQKAAKEKQAQEMKKPTSSDKEQETDLNDMSYSQGLAWDEVLGTTELDPSIKNNHKNFVQSTKRFSSGANFTNVNDDNNNSAFTRFVGLNRPSHVPIGASARVVPDVDETVLQRNNRLRW